MSREYTLAMSSASVLSQVVSLAYFQAPSAAPVTTLEVLRGWASQSANATSAQQRIQLSTQVSPFPTQAAGQAPQKIKAGDPISVISASSSGAAGTSMVNATTDAAGAKTVLIPDAFNVLNGWLWVPTPTETHLECAQATAHGYALVFPVAPGTLTFWNAGLVMRELG